MSALSPRRVQQLVAESIGITRAELRMRRSSEAHRARHFAMYACRTILKMSYPQIGMAFSRDHSTVLIALRDFVPTNEEELLLASMRLWATPADVRSPDDVVRRLHVIEEDLRRLCATVMELKDELIARQLAATAAAPTKG